MIENPENLNMHAIELANQGYFPEAIACFKKAINFDKTNFLLWYNLGITYRDSGDLESALESLLNAFLLDETDEELIETIATIYHSQGNTDEAFSFCARGLDINDKNAKFWNLVGVLFFSRTEYSQASTAFESAVTIDPFYYDALFNLRDTYNELGNITGTEDCEARMQAIRNKGNINA